MAIVQQPTAGLASASGAMWSQAANLRQHQNILLDMTERRRQEREQRFWGGIQEYKEQRALRKADEGGGYGGAIGAGAGAVIGGILTAVTGGAAAPLIPALMSAGAGIGTAVDTDNPNAAAGAITDAIDAFAENPYFTTPRTDDGTVRQTQKAPSTAPPDAGTGGGGPGWGPPSSGGAPKAPKIALPEPIESVFPTPTGGKGGILSLLETGLWGKGGGAGQQDGAKTLLDLVKNPFYVAPFAGFPASGG